MAVNISVERAGGDRGFGDAWKLFHGEIRGVAAARVRSAVAYSKRRPREFKPGNSQGSTCAWAGITGARRAGEKRR